MRDLVDQLLMYWPWIAVPFGGFIALYTAAMVDPPEKPPHYEISE